MDLNLYEDQDPEIASQELDWEPEIALNHRQEVPQLAVVAQVEHKVAMESQTRGLVNTNSDHYSKGGNLACLYSHLGRKISSSFISSQSSSSYIRKYMPE